MLSVGSEKPLIRGGSTGAPGMRETFRIDRYEQRLR
jgi:hypothetical protein